MYIKLNDNTTIPIVSATPGIRNNTNGKYPEIIINFKTNITNEQLEMIKKNFEIYGDNEQFIGSYSDYDICENISIILAQLSDSEKETEKLIAEKNAAIVEKNAAIKEKVEAITAKNELLGYLNQITLEKTNIANEKEKAILDKQQAIIEKDKILNEKNNLIDLNDQLVKEKMEISKEKNLIAEEKDRIILDKENAIFERDEKINQLDILTEEYQNLQNDFENIQKILQEKEKIIDAIPSEGVPTEKAPAGYKYIKVFSEIQGKFIYEKAIDLNNPIPWSPYLDVKKNFTYYDPNQEQKEKEIYFCLKDHTSEESLAGSKYFTLYSE